MQHVGPSKCSQCPAADSPASSHSVIMQLTQVSTCSDIRQGILCFLCSNDMVRIFCTCTLLRLPYGDDALTIKQCFLMWLNSSGVNAHLLEILASTSTRLAVMDFLHVEDLVRTYLSCRTLKKGFLDEIEDVRQCWFRWWDLQRDKWAHTEDAARDTQRAVDMAGQRSFWRGRAIQVARQVALVPWLEWRYVLAPRNTFLRDCLPENRSND